MADPCSLKYTMEIPGRTRTFQAVSEHRQEFPLCFCILISSYGRKNSTQLARPVYLFPRAGHKWGPCSVDRFASNLNNHCAGFNSRWWCPGIEGVDAFGQYWGLEQNWLVPPPRLIARVIAKLQKDRAKGILVIPVWKSSPFWPLFINKDEKMKAEVMDYEILPQANLIKKSSGNNGIFGVDPLKLKMIAPSLNFEKN